MMAISSWIGRATLRWLPTGWWQIAMRLTYLFSNLSFSKILSCLSNDTEWCPTCPPHESCSMVKRIEYDFLRRGKEGRVLCCCGSGRWMEREGEREKGKVKWWRWGSVRMLQVVSSCTWNQPAKHRGKTTNFAGWGLQPISRRRPLLQSPIVKETPTSFSCFPFIVRPTQTANKRAMAL